MRHTWDGRYWQLRDIYAVVVQCEGMNLRKKKWWFSWWWWWVVMVMAVVMTNWKERENHGYDDDDLGTLASVTMCNDFWQWHDLISTSAREGYQNRTTKLPTFHSHRVSFFPQYRLKAMADIDQVPDNLSDAGRIGSDQTPKSRTKALRPRQHFLKKGKRIGPTFPSTTVEKWRFHL